ncbi:hypothetical protein [Nocardioides sp.]|uniref:hypothetical protein n=1 Tax=Nocardioides sp. TaxID=35761 RepID=UPI002B67B154|nr:hypothetical protein [Nocardioides sp.]HXH77153.1 hypothetical protein [Nocardioides sp.]
MSTLDLFRAEITAYDRSRARSQQTEPGASQTYSCRAATVLRANGVPETDETDSWASIVGTAIHLTAEHAAGKGVLTEHRVSYRGVPATIDRYRDGVLSDVKTKADAAAIAKARNYGPHSGHVGQIMLGAGGLIAEGLDVHTVELLFIPRNGSLDDAYLWSAPYDRALADEAADWHEQVRKLIAERSGLEPADQADGLRDQPMSWCAAYCEFRTACRGPAPVDPEVDALVHATVLEFLEADDAEKAAKQTKDAARRFLAPYDALPGLRWQGGNSRSSEELDLDRLLEDYRALIGEPPMRTVEKVTARSLRRTS